VRPDLSKACLRGANLSWADLRGANLDRAILREAILRDADLSRVNLAGADLCEADLSRANLAGANLSRAAFHKASLHGANLAGANLSEAILIEADLSGADVSKASLSGGSLIEASLHGANLSAADLSGGNLIEANLFRADFAGAILHEADLSGADLIHTNFTGANRTNCRVYGISAWDLKLEGAKQKDLIITPDSEPEITVDNLEVAQFIYLLLNNKRVRHVIDTITSKVVLIVGRFTPEREAVLDALREELRRRDYTPVLFDFDKPARKDLTGTVQTLANMPGSSSPISRTRGAFRTSWRWLSRLPRSPPSRSFWMHSLSTRCPRT
jgi:uncharacterized protein YjbI with pentapeptide repeats